MAGISSNALKGMNYPENRKKYNGNELQSKEFGDGAGLEWTDFNARTYDQQIGRFQQIDPWVEVGSQEMLTPYQFAYNNPVRYNDPDGKCPLCLPVVLPTVVEGLAALGAATGITAVIYKAADKLRDVDWSELGAGSQTTFVPHITIPQSVVRKMEKDEKAKSLEKEIGKLEGQIETHDKTIKKHEKKLDDYKKDPDSQDHEGRLKDVTPEIREKRIKGRIENLEKQLKNQRQQQASDKQKLETAKKELERVNKERANNKNS